jgi:hypothetical protein
VITCRKCQEVPHGRELTGGHIAAEVGVTPATQFMSAQSFGVEEEFLATEIILIFALGQAVLRDLISPPSIAWQGGRLSRCGSGQIGGGALEKKNSLASNHIDTDLLQVSWQEKLRDLTQRPGCLDRIK